MSLPGTIFQYPYQYSPRFSWGQGNVRVVSLVAAEDIPTGVVVQIKPGTEQIQIARDAWAIAGVSVYDPAHHTSDVVYNKYDVVPVLRVGSVFARFITMKTPFRDPRACEDAFFYVDTGKFTTDLSDGVRLSGACFNVSTHEYYPNTDGSPAADVPYKVPPVPLGATSTTFGEGVCLVDLNLG